ncbi:MAG: lipid-A-disaccharide synthase [Candidatus Zixiibacteriota bacterium]
MNNKTVFLSAGDISGDNAASKLVFSLKKLNPNLNFFGLGGNKLKKLGQYQLAEPEELAVIGFWEVAKRYLFFRKLLKLCLCEIKNKKPAVVILVDYPGFNLRLAKLIKGLGIPIIYYISPQIWAWGQKRVKEIKKNIELMLLILPFEEQFYHNSGVNNIFVGHYLLEEIPSEYISSSAPSNGSLTLMPGSRPQEIEQMLPPMLKAAKLFKKKCGGRIIITGVKSFNHYHKYLELYKSEKIEINYDNPLETIYNSTMVLVSSGTATLETAIIGRPMVVVYKTGFLTYHIARMLVKLDNISLVNLILNEKVVPELIQNDVNSENMFFELEKLYNDKSYYNSIKLKLNKIPELLGGKGASERAAKLIISYIN